MFSEIEGILYGETAEFSEAGFMKVEGKDLARIDSAGMS